MYQQVQLAITCAFVVWVSTLPSHAENIIYPRVKSGFTDASGIVDVTLSPYNADPTGATDATAALQSACDDHPEYTTVYLPNGTYLISNTLRISDICETGGGGDCGVSAPRLQGQSTDGTVIKLASGTFTNAGSPQPVLFSGDGVAQIFHRGIHNLTVLVAANNAGANGVRWFSNNAGLMSDVDFVSEDEAANVGVDIYGGEEGPCGMRDIHVTGFKTGVRSNALNSVTILNLTVENASSYGVLNETNPLYIDNLTCINTNVGVRNTGSMTLVNALLTGGSGSNPAVENTGMLFARDIQAEGYQRALSTNGPTAPSGMTVEEYTTGQVSLFPSPTHSMDLPNRDIPDVPWEQDTTKWGNVWVNKGGLGSISKSDVESFQSLVDDPNITTICLPSGRAFQMNEDIVVRGNISRIVGTSGNLGGSARLVISSELTAPVLKIERIILGIPIINQSDKTVIIESCMGGQSGIMTSTGTGDLFIIDVCGSPITFNSPTQRVWAWQYNVEGGSGVVGDEHIKTIIQDIGAMRIFGWKDEPQFQSLELQNGIVEILGYMYYASSSTSGQTMFEVQDGGHFSAAGVTQVSFNGTSFTNLVEQTRGTDTQMLTSSNSGSGGNLPLFTGYDSATVANTLATGVAPENQPRHKPERLVRIGANWIDIASLTGPEAGPVSVKLYSVKGSLIQAGIVHRDDVAGSGRYAFPTAVAPGSYVLSVKSQGVSRVIRLMLR